MKIRTITSNNGYILLCGLVFFMMFSFVLNQKIEEMYHYLQIKSNLKRIDFRINIENKALSLIRSKNENCSFTYEQIIIHCEYDDKKVNIYFDGERRTELNYDIMEDGSFKLIHMEE